MDRLHKLMTIFQRTRAAPGEHPARAPSMGIARLRLVFLAPPLGALTLVVGVWAPVLHLYQRDTIEEEIGRARSLVERVHRGDISYDIGHSVHRRGRCRYHALR